MTATSCLSSGSKVGWMLRALVALGIAALMRASQAADPGWTDASPHMARLVSVAPDVQLETLDWGGHGRPVVLLAGLGNSAHIYDDLAEQMRARYHVYGVTRRGFGKSSAPKEGYDTDRLADDVIAALDALKLKRVVLVGHSIAGLELSSIAARHPDRVAGLVYLDTAYIFEKDDKDLFGVGEWYQHLQALRSRLDALETAENNPTPEARQLVDSDLPSFSKDMDLLLAAEAARPPFVPPGPFDVASFAAFRGWFSRVQGFEPPEAELRETFTSDVYGIITGQKSPQWISNQILAGQKKYTGITVPTLGLFAVRSKPSPNLPDDEKSRKAIDAFETVAKTRAQRRADALKHDIPGAKIVFVERAPHQVFLSNSAEVRQLIDSFVAGLPN
jgi:non-heme chloroperoxidase